MDIKPINSAEDDAGVRLVGSDDKNGRKENNIEVKYMTPDSQNGDARIDIENLKTAFAGMGKEELMKYANDPFWVKMRWFLFILFWLVWIAMLAGSIAIIVLAPKCSAPTPREWWEQSPLYQIDVRSFKDGSDTQDGIGDLKGLESKLDYLHDLGVKTVVLSNILKSADIEALPSEDGDIDSGNTVDYQNIDEKIGTLEQFRSLANKMKEKGLYMLMSFIPNHSSDKHPWFLKSINGEEPFKDYYVWAPVREYDADGVTPLPPNNWLSKNGNSAWEYNSKRKMFYLHQFNKSQPDFNFHNKLVVDYFKDVMKFWLDTGVSGFHLDKVQYLLEDQNLHDEDINDDGHSGSPSGAVHTEYKFYNHKFTSYLPGLSNILKQWNNQISANNSGILSMTSMNPLAADQGTLIVDTNYTDVKETAVGQLFVKPQLLPDSFTANDLKTVVDAALRSSKWPTWQFLCKSGGTACIKEELYRGIQMVSLLLPGTPVTRSGAELGLIKIGIMPWNNNPNGGFTTADKPWRELNSNYAEINVQSQLSDKSSPLATYKKLLAIRESPAIMHGSNNIVVMNNTFVFTRIKSGNPGYVTAFNLHSNATIVDLTQLPMVPVDLSVVASTAPLNSLNLTDTSGKEKRDARAVLIDGYSALVLQFVPSGGNN